MSGLPQGFTDLEGFVDYWAADTTPARARLRDESSAEDKEAFFHAILPQVDEALALLDAKPLAELDQAETNLLNMLLSFAHVSLAVEIHGARSEGRHVRYRQYMKITRSPADEELA